MCYILCNKSDPENIYKIKIVSMLFTVQIWKQKIHPGGFVIFSYLIILLCPVPFNLAKTTICKRFALHI